MTSNATINATRLQSLLAVFLCAAIAPQALVAQPARSEGRRFFVSSVSGNDRNSGLSPEQAWATAGKLNAVWAAGGIHPCDTVAIDKAGDLRDDYLKIVNPTIATPASSTTMPLPSSGAPGCPITVTSYGSGNGGIDAADVVTGVNWKPVRGMNGVFEATFTQHPGKLYVDPNDRDTPQLLPVSNAAGVYSTTATYHEYDLVTDPDGKGLQYLRSPGPQSTINTPLNAHAVWGRVDNPARRNDSQSFSSTNSGQQNVAETPGTWYITASGSAWTVFVHLSDGSDPSRHTLEATHRDYGAYLQSVDYVNLTNLKFEHAMKSCVEKIAFADSTKGGGYFTNEYNVDSGLTVFNCGNVGGQTVDQLQARTNSFIAGILVRPGGETNPHLLRGDQTIGANVGTIDVYYGLRGATLSGGIKYVGIDGGGAANRDVISHNTVHTTNSGGISYTPLGLAGTETNLGGRVSYNTVYSSILNIDFGGVTGGRLDHNFIHDSKGQGVQTGGPASISNPSTPFVIDHNVIANLGPAPSTVGYNGVDCNGATPGQFKIYLINNTVFNTAMAGFTFEGGCTGSTVINNIVDQNALLTQQSPNTSQGSGYNGASFIYFVKESHTPDVNWSHNAWITHDNGPVQTRNAGGPKFSGAYTCEAFAAQWPEPVHTCSDVDPMFVNARGGANTANDFRLQPASPMRNAGMAFKIGGVESTLDLGAIPYGSKFPF